MTTEATAPLDAGNGDPARNPAAQPQPKWFEDARFEGSRDWIAAKGLGTVEDPLAALERTIAVGRGAERHLGRPAESLVEKPRDGQPLAEWMRGQRELFGLPEGADKYEIARPEMPAGVAWDEGFEAKAREIAFEHGVPPAALNAFVSAYGERVAGMMADAETQLQAANAEMMTELEAQWGRETPGKIAQARQAVAAVAAQAKLGPDAIADIALALKPRVGDAGIVRLFAAIGEMMGEDTLGGAAAATTAGGGLAMTPEEARQQLAVFESPQGDYGRAYNARDRASLAALEPRRQALLRIAAGKS